MNEMIAKQLEKAASKAVRMLRENKLSNGLPFMINSEELPSRQCYLEYPDGSINLVALNAAKTDFITIKKLTKKAVQCLRKKHKLSNLAQ